MKKTLSVLFLFCLSTLSAFAAPECGLKEGSNPVTSSGIHTDYYFRDSSEKANGVTQSKLTDLQQQQLIAAAADFAKSVGEKMKDSSVKTAIDYLLSYSADLYSFDFKQNGHDFTLVTIFPGDSLGGSVFAKGSSNSVAGISDVGIFCKP